jgi:hypothetical protein
MGGQAMICEHGKALLPRSVYTRHTSQHRIAEKKDEIVTG